MHALLPLPSYSDIVLQSPNLWTLIKSGRLRTPTMDLLAGRRLLWMSTKNSEYPSPTSGNFFPAPQQSCLLIYSSGAAQLEIPALLRRLGSTATSCRSPNDLSATLRPRRENRLSESTRASASRFLFHRCSQGASRQLHTKVVRREHIRPPTQFSPDRRATVLELRRVSTLCQRRLRGMDLRSHS